MPPCCACAPFRPRIAATEGAYEMGYFAETLGQAHRKFAHPAECVEIVWSVSSRLCKLKTAGHRTEISVYNACVSTRFWELPETL